MRCSHCDADTPEGAKFCMECGTPLRARCPQCGADMLPRAKLCGECGTPLTEQRPGLPPAQPQLPVSYTPTHLAEKINYRGASVKIDFGSMVIWCHPLRCGRSTTAAILLRCRWKRPNAERGR